MGIISISDVPLHNEKEKIRRLNERKKAMAFTEKHGVDIIAYVKSARIGVEKLKLDPNLSFEFAFQIPSDYQYGHLWHCGWFISTDQNPRPNWSGFLRTSTNNHNQNDDKSVLLSSFQSLISVLQTKHVYIYSTLKFVIQQARKFQVEVPCITFDQPLWLKAMGIIQEEELSIVCRLGGFHTLMSFLGSIGVLMKGSGVEDLFTEVYAENSVSHIISGKAIAKALREHVLAESALMTLLLEKLQEDDKIDVEFLRDFYQMILSNEREEESFHELQFSEEFVQIENQIEEIKKSLKAKSRTSQLWLLYMDYIKLVKLFIYWQRTSNWELHLYIVSQMLNLFASTGHINYAKSARLCSRDA